MSAIDALVTELSRLPTIGRKSAVRLTYHLLKQPAEQSRRLAEALVALTERVRPCAECFNLTEGERCAICADPRRDASLLCVIEEASDLPAIERTGEFRGRYHVLGGRLAPLDGIGPSDLTVGALVRRLEGGAVREVIVATNATLEGEATALFVQEQVRSSGVTVSRLARGLPMGGDLEYADGGTIAQAFSARRVM
ncbi:MAG: recombination mediator RecR [Gemmatimonadota bacterium]|jgi:recombination protein RecR|nr:recombination mediator RecR [Gemmatimonadota bacterium]MDQ8148004.1 recombination mediator RecR [Gemmatimonadota bacterium]MDQ8149893.1 recombination mediator RecR [Gemmatimonadota bacterium]MDQ8157528.1 recombination mediator RecR [Gemmatimonadota bacterium]MDQ8177599.1 recombination mediator RecR [Gemmatimonadota bacterium]